MKIIKQCTLVVNTLEDNTYEVNLANLNTFLGVATSMVDSDYAAAKISISTDDIEASLVITQVVER